MKEIRRNLHLLTSIVMLAAALAGNAVAAVPVGTLTMPHAGESGYTSAHAYVTPTEIEGVYRVTQTISSYVEKVFPRADVYVVIDQSSSMDYDVVADDAEHYPNYGGKNTAIRAVRAGLIAMTDVFWPDSGKSMEEMAIFRVGVVGFGNRIMSDTSYSPFMTPGTDHAGMVTYDKKAELRTHINNLWGTSETNMPAGVLRVLRGYSSGPDPRAYKSEAGSWSTNMLPGGLLSLSTYPANGTVENVFALAPVTADFPAPDKRFLVIIGDGITDTSYDSTVNIVQESMRKEEIDDVFTMGVSGKGFYNDAANVPAVPALYNGTEKVPTSNQPNEQALIHIATVFTKETYAAAAPKSLNVPSHAPNFDAAWPAYAGRMNEVVDHYNYYYADDVANARIAFENIANSIVSQLNVPASGAFASIVLGDGFELYQYPGEAFLAQTGARKSDGSGVWNAAGTVSATGKSIRWNIDELPDDGSLLSLVYYIKANDDNLAQYAYPVFLESYLYYNAVQNIGGVDSPGSIVVSFPAPYIFGNGEIDQAGGDMEVDGESTAGSAGEAGDNGGLIPLFVIPYNSIAERYSPSVPTVVKSLPNEPLQELPTEIEIEEIAVDRVMESAKESLIIGPRAKP